jgi:hypothetical protein
MDWPRLLIESDLLCQTVTAYRFFLGTLLLLNLFLPETRYSLRYKMVFAFLLPSLNLRRINTPLLGKAELGLDISQTSDDFLYGYY